MFIPMFCKASLLLTITFAGIASASPTSRSANDGLAVLLSKRNVLTRADGVFDFEKAKIHIARVRAKHRQNLINIKNNNGAGFLNKGYEIKPLTNLDHGHRNEPLTYHEQDSDWSGSITIGTPGQKFDIEFATGTADLWVPSSECTSCSHNNKYSAQNSSTGTRVQGEFRITYTDGTFAYGPIYEETVAVGGITVTNQSFSPITSMSEFFDEASSDGILGLSLPGMSVMGKPPFFVNAVAQGQVSSKEFGMFLAEVGSELYLGGTNPAKYSGKVEFHKLDTNSGYWQIGLASVHVGEHTMGGHLSTIIDSGSEFIGGYPKDVEAFYSKIPGAKLYDSTNGYYSFHCENVPSVAFSWGKGKNWNISAENFNLGLTKPNSSECIGAILGQDLGLGISTWYLGDSFMKNVYSVFSLDHGVGFAKLVGNKA